MHAEAGGSAKRMGASKVGQAFLPVLKRRLERDCVDCARPRALSAPPPAAVKTSSGGGCDGRELRNSRSRLRYRKRAEPRAFKNAPASPCARRTPLWPTEYASLSGWVLVSSKSLSGSLSGSGSTSAPSEVWSSRHPRRHRRSPVGRRQSLVSESHWFPSSFDTDPDSDFDIDAPTGASAPSSTLLPPELSFRPHSMR